MKLRLASRFTNGCNESDSSTPNGHPVFELSDSVSFFKLMAFNSNLIHFIKFYVP